MPGATDNTTLLAAQNQTIVALNELTSTLQGLTLTASIDTSGIEQQLAVIAGRLAPADENIAQRLKYSAPTSTDEDIYTALQAIKTELEPSTINGLITKLVGTSGLNDKRIRALVEVIMNYLIPGQDLTIEEAQFLVETFTSMTGLAIDASVFALDIYNAGLNTEDEIEKVIDSGAKIAGDAIDASISTAQAGISAVDAAIDLGDLITDFLEWVGWSETGFYHKKHIARLDTLISTLAALDCGSDVTCSPDVNLTCTPAVTCGSSGSSSSSGGYGGIYGIDDDASDGQTDSSTAPSDWSEDTYGDFDTYKCKAANVMILNLAEFLATCNVLVLKDYSLYPTNQSIIEWIGTTLANMSYAIGTMLDTASATIGKMLNCAGGVLTGSPNACGEGGGGTEITFGETTGFYDVRLKLLNDRSDAVCELFNSLSVSDASTALTDRISGYLDEGSYSSDEKTLCLNCLSQYLSNVWLNRLFEYDSQIANYSDTSATDCESCAANLVYIQNPCSLEHAAGELTSGDLKTQGTFSSLTSYFNCDTGQPRQYIIIVAVSGPITFTVDSYANSEGTLRVEWSDENNSFHSSTNSADWPFPTFIGYFLDFWLDDGSNHPDGSVTATVSYSASS